MVGLLTIKQFNHQAIVKYNDKKLFQNSLE